MRICDCSGAVLVGATLMTFMPPIAGIGYFIIQLLGSWKRGRWQGFSRLSTFCALPVAVVALNSMSVGGMVCPLCLGVWVCFGVVVAATVREIVARAKPLSVVRSLASVVVLLVVGIAVAQGVGAMSEPNPNCDPDGHCCDYGCYPEGPLGGSTLRLPNGYDRCYDWNGPGCDWMSCFMRVYEEPDCPGNGWWYGQYYSRKCCHHLPPPPK
ncbi:MAG: hypothetical protein AMXMBFR61_04790 [Fimbriimonadales bacterium]